MNIKEITTNDVTLGRKKADRKNPFHRMVEECSANASIKAKHVVTGTVPNVKMDVLARAFQNKESEKMRV